MQDTDNNTWLKRAFRQYKGAFLLMLLTVCLPAKAQTPVANRVNAAASTLSRSCQIAAKYTDNQRHCLYYVSNNRLYRYDVMTGKKREVKFSPDGYSRITNTYITENGTYLFVCADKDASSKGSPEDIQELWRINTFSNKSKKIAEGFEIEKGEDRFIIKTLVKRLETLSPSGKPQWKAQDRYYRLDGQSMAAGEEYTVK